MMLAAFVLVAATAGTPDAIIEREVATTRAYDRATFTADRIPGWALHPII